MTLRFPDSTTKISSRQAPRLATERDQSFLGALGDRYRRSPAQATTAATPKRV